MFSTNEVSLTLYHKVLSSKKALKEKGLGKHCRKRKKCWLHFRKRFLLIKVYKANTSTNELKRIHCNAVVKYEFYTGKLCSKDGLIFCNKPFAWTFISHSWNFVYPFNTK